MSARDSGGASAGGSYQGTALPPLPLLPPQQPLNKVSLKFKLGNPSSALPALPSPSGVTGHPPQDTYYQTAAFQNSFPSQQYNPYQVHQQQPQPQYYQNYNPDQPQHDMARLSGGGRNAAPAETYTTFSGRPSRQRAQVNYQEDLQFSNAAVKQGNYAYQQAASAPTGNRSQRSQPPAYAPQSIPPVPMQVSTRRASYPQSTSSGGDMGGYGRTPKAEMEEEEEDYAEEGGEEDADGSFHDSADYSAGGRAKRGAPKAGRGGRGKGKGKGTSAYTRKRNSYGREDDEDDFVMEDDEGEYEDPSLQVASGSFRRVPQSRQTKAGSANHPNFQASSSEEEEDGDVPLAAAARQTQFSTSGRPVRAAAPQTFNGTQMIPDSEPDAHYMSSSTASAMARSGSNNNGQLPLGDLFSDSAEVVVSAMRKKKHVVEDDEEDAEGETETPSEGYAVIASNDGQGRYQVQAHLSVPNVQSQPYETSSGRRTARKAIVESEDEEDVTLKSSPKKRSQSRQARKYLGEDDDGSEGSYHDDGEDDYTEKRKSKRKVARFTNRRSTRNSRRAGEDDDDEEYEDNSRRRRRSISTASDDLPDLTDAESQDELMLQAAGRIAKGKDGRNYRLRKRNEVNYSLPAMFGLNQDGTPAANADEDTAKKDKPKKKKSGYGGPKHLPFNMSGRQLGSLFGENPPDSSSDDDMQTPRRPGAIGGAMSAGAAPMDFSTAGTPSNLGKISGATNLADIDPLLPHTQLSFDSVGGLQSHIQQLKEMVSLPLLYPEVFQRFGITPPRGVLFHGPPGTGKTLLARALAASCSSEGQKISFFMRKGADVLSKWVGEAERQLRLLFEEAKNSQPSIIFFDEIDGLAPVRSSKQDQIHASIVSTLLALMDGMDGRGQVIVIGATNRPDAVDPALRRPGRFDREFYFPLPDLEARRKIIEINTRKWDPPMKDEFLDELAHLTKGYGGADLRALCTEAALNAVQRKYPQIYKTTNRLLINPEKIDVIARDFIISAKNLIPSTARSTSTLAAPLPSHLEPLLRANLDRAIASLSRILPEVRKVNVLQEAELEPLGDGGFEQERLMQTFENLRVFRPRLLIAGEEGLGQSFIGAAVLHHLEGFHVQSLDLATLVGDSARTAEAACVQIFNEAKRHKPSIIYIPSLDGWSQSVGESTKNTIRGLLDSLEPSDPILLMAVAEAPFLEISSDVKSWFGFLRNNRVVLNAPSTDQRRLFFAETVTYIARKPTDYPDAMPRKKRVLEELPIAPPPPPRQPTAAELEVQAQSDARLREYLKFRLGPIVLELKKRFKKFLKPIGDGEEIQIVQEGATAAIAQVDNNPDDDDVVFVTSRRVSSASIVGRPELSAPASDKALATGNGHKDGSPMESIEGPSEPIVPSTTAVPDASAQAVTGEAAAAAPSANVEGAKIITFRFHEISLEKIESRLYSDKYHTPEAFLFEVQRIVENAYHEGEVDTLSKADQMLNNARIMVDQACDAGFRIECSRMAEREKDRRKLRQESRRKAREERESVNNGQQVKTVADPADQGPNGNKRPREDDTDEQDVELAKRARTEAMQEDDVTSRNTLANGQIGLPARFDSSGRLPANVPESPLHVLSTSAKGSSLGGSSITDLTSTSAPTSSITSSSTTSFQPDAANPGIGQVTIPAIPVGTPSPPPAPLPDFVLPTRQLSELTRVLESQTEDLSVDELEQLRAACYDCIWRARKEWNKTALLEEIRGMVDDFVGDVKQNRM